MAKIKHTKNELKAQRESLARFQRFLPMLLLKKQQLQAEIQAVDAQLDEKNAAEQKLRAALETWVGLFASDPRREILPPGVAAPPPIGELIALDTVQTEEGNIAGVSIPVLTGVTFTRQPLDLFATPAWYDDGVDAMEQLIRLQVERDVLNEQKERLAEELRTTSQRVNLFEKVKIPECREHIRVIKIFLGDEQTAGVVRSKIAKGRAVAYQAAKEAAQATGVGA
jgi:V/A-type H+-transporting ATPase subunit D